MTSTYAKPFSVPEPFIDVARSFTRELLREVTYLRLKDDEKSLIEYAVNYFTNYDPEKNKKTQPNQQKNDSDDRTISLLFQREDPNKTNYVDYRTFYNIVKEIVFDVVPKVAEIKQKPYEPDNMFVYIALGHIEVFSSDKIVYTELIKPLSLLVDDIIEYQMPMDNELCFHGMSQREFEDTLFSLVSYIDNNHLDIHYLYNNKFIGFNKKEITMFNWLLTQSLDYHDAIPLFIKLCCAYHNIYNVLRFTSGAPTDYFYVLQSFCQQLDSLKTNELSSSQLKQVLYSVDYNLNLIEILSILVKSFKYSQDSANYNSFCTECAFMIDQYVNNEQLPCLQNVYGLEEEPFLNQLKDGFSQYYNDHKTTKINRKDYEDIIKSIFPEISENDLFLFILMLDWIEDETNYEFIFFYAYKILIRLSKPN